MLDFRTVFTFYCIYIGGFDLYFLGGRGCVALWNRTFFGVEGALRFVTLRFCGVEGSSRFGTSHFCGVKGPLHFGRLRVLRGRRDPALWEPYSTFLRGRGGLALWNFTFLRGRGGLALWSLTFLRVEGALNFRTLRFCRQSGPCALEVSFSGLMRPCALELYVFAGYRGVWNFAV